MFAKYFCNSRSSQMDQIRQDICNAKQEILDINRQVSVVEKEYASIYPGVIENIDLYRKLSSREDKVAFIELVKIAKFHSLTHEETEAFLAFMIPTAPFQKNTPLAHAILRRTQPGIYA